MKPSLTHGFSLLLYVISKLNGVFTPFVANRTPQAQDTTTDNHHKRNNTSNHQYPHHNSTSAYKNTHLIYWRRNYSLPTMQYARIKKITKGENYKPQNESTSQISETNIPLRQCSFPNKHPKKKKGADMAENLPKFSENAALQMMCEGFYVALNNRLTLLLSFVEIKRNGTSELHVIADNRFVRFPPFGFTQDIFIALKILADKSAEKDIVGKFSTEERTMMTLEGKIQERRWDIILDKEDKKDTRKANFGTLWEISKNEIALAIHNARRPQH